MPSETERGRWWGKRIRGGGEELAEMTNPQLIYGDQTYTNITSRIGATRTRPMSSVTEFASRPPFCASCIMFRHGILSARTAWYDSSQQQHCGNADLLKVLGVCVPGMCRPADLRSCSGFKDLGPFMGLISVATCLIEPLLAVPPSDLALSGKLSRETRTFLHLLSFQSECAIYHIVALASNP